MDPVATDIATVVLIDVRGSTELDARRYVPRLDALVAQLNQRYAGQLLGAFERAMDDEMQGVLLAGADPLDAYLLPALEREPLPLRTVIVRGALHPAEPGTPARLRFGPAFRAARKVTAEQRGRILTPISGEAETDAWLALTAEWLAEWVEGLTPRARAITAAALTSGTDDRGTVAAISRATGESHQLVSQTLKRPEVVKILALVDRMRAAFTPTEAE